MSLRQILVQTSHELFKMLNPIPQIGTGPWRAPRESRIKPWSRSTAHQTLESPAYAAFMNSQEPERWSQIFRLKFLGMRSS